MYEKEINQPIDGYYEADANKHATYIWAFSKLYPVTFKRGAYNNQYS